MYPDSIHVLCITHIVNLASELFRHHNDFKHASDLIALVKSSLFKKPGRKNRFIQFLADFIASADVKLPPVPISSRWNSWFEAASCHVIGRGLSHTCDRSMERRLGGALNATAARSKRHHDPPV